MNKILSMLIIGSSLLGTLASAEELILPTISSPSFLDEGTQRELSMAQIAELLPWAKDSKMFLVDLIDNAQSLPMEQRLERLLEGVEQVVKESQSKKSELVMRYSLNRSLVLYKILDQEMDSQVVGSIDIKVRVLMQSIKLAISYYDTDVLNLSKKTTLPFAQFGLEYFGFLHELNKSIFDASAQYNIQRTALEFLQWDLYRDLNNISYAPQIIKINNALKIFPQKKMSDAYSINYIRQMKKVVEQLSLPKASLSNTSAAEVTNIFSKKEEGVAPVTSRINRKNFKTYDGDCYAADKEGRILWDAGKLDWKSCHGGDYAPYDGKCYAVDFNSSNKLWGAGVMPWKLCHSGSYKSYDGACYPTDKSNNILWSAGKTSYVNCQ